MSSWWTATPVTESRWSSGSSAKGGDTIDIDFAAGIVYRNGVALDEPYTAEPTYLYESVDFPITVPDGSPL